MRIGSTHPTVRAVQRPLKRVFAAPACIGLASIVGLVAALVADGLWDAVSWVGLGVAVVVSAWCGLGAGLRTVSSGPLVLVEAFRQDSSTGIRKPKPARASCQPELPPQR